LTFDLQRHKLHLPLLLAGGASGVTQKWLPTLKKGGGERKERGGRETERGKKGKGEKEGWRDDKLIITVQYTHQCIRMYLK
jgi:hypothetical protein